MNHTDPAKNDIPEFPSDPMTDWVLNNEDRPVIRNGEIINEPDDVEENAIDAKNSWKASDKDCWFPIHFSFSGIDYTADVLKKDGDVREYNVTGISPAIDHLPDPFIIASTLSKDAYDFPVNETYYPRELGRVILTAIGTGCNHADVAIA